MVCVEERKVHDGIRASSRWRTGRMSHGSGVHREYRFEPVFEFEPPMRLCFALIAFVWFESGVALAEESYVALTGLDGQKSTLTLAELDALPHLKISVNEHRAPHVFEGALLGDVLAKVSAPAGKAIRGAELADVVIVEARDGYNERTRRSRYALSSVVRIKGEIGRPVVLAIISLPLSCASASL